MAAQPEQMVDFENIAYLREGNERQQAAYAALTRHRVMETLAPFDPLLAGTIPLGIDVPESDLDIVCCWRDPQHFTAILRAAFSTFPAFRILTKTIQSHETILARFHLDDFEVEVFGQNRPSREQEAFRHLLVEQRLLATHGELFRQQVIALKQQGVKTEPAFAQLLHLEGDPYEALLQL